MSPVRLRPLALIAILCLAGCAKKDAPAPPQEPASTTAAPGPLAVAAITIGRSIDGMKMVMTPVDTLKNTDTIYASVSTTGVGANATIGAKWVYLKKAGAEISVNETSQTITTTGPSYTEFHITKASPWPAGEYRVDISLNGSPVGNHTFVVR